MPLTDNVATLAQSRWLATHGFRQDGWPQMVWRVPGPHSDFREWIKYCSGPPPAFDADDVWCWKWYAAPPLVGDGPDTVLGWLEATYGWRWHRGRHRDTGAVHWHAFNPDWKLADVEAPTASELADKVMATVDAREGAGG